LKKPREFFRFPNGAKFEAIYNADTTSWTATLTIDGVATSITRQGIHWALKDLGKQWHKENKV